MKTKIESNTSDSNANEVFASSGNVFADLGLPDAEERLVKAKLAQAIRQRVRGYDLTQIQAADVLGTTQARVSDLMNGKVARMSYDLLLGYLSALECDVTIVLSPRHAAERVLSEDAHSHKYERGQIMVGA